MCVVWLRGTVVERHNGQRRVALESKSTESIMNFIGTNTRGSAGSK